MGYCSRCEKECEGIGKRGNLCPDCGLIIRKHPPSKDGDKQEKSLTQKTSKEYPDTGSSKQINFNAKTLATIEKLEQDGHGESRDEIIKKALESYSQNLPNQNWVRDPIQKMREEITMADLKKQLKETNTNNNDNMEGPSKIIKQIQEAEVSKEIINIYKDKKDKNPPTEDEFDKMERQMAKQLRMKQMNKLLSNDGEDFGIKEMMKYQMFRNMMGTQDTNQSNQSNPQLQALMQEIKDMKRDQFHQQEKQMLQDQFKTQIQALQSNKPNQAVDAIKEHHRALAEQQQRSQSEKDVMQQQIQQKDQELLKEQLDSRVKDLQDKVMGARQSNALPDQVQKFKQELESLKELQEALGPNNNKSMTDTAIEGLVKNAPSILQSLSDATQAKRAQQELERTKLAQQIQAQQQAQTQQQSPEGQDEASIKLMPNSPQKTPGLSQTEQSMSNTMGDIYIRKTKPKPRPEPV